MTYIELCYNNCNMAFNEWLLQKIEQSGLSYSELGRRGGISHARISQVVSGDKPGAEFCLAIARALGERPETVMRLAGLLPSLPGPEDARSLKELLEITQQLTLRDRQDVLEYATWRYHRQQERQKETQQ